MRTREASPASGVRGMRADARRNRDRLLTAARAAFAEYGTETQMDDIARRAGVGVGTLYRHFPTKDELVAELVRVKLSDFALRARARFDEDERPWESFAGLLRDQTKLMLGDASQQRMIFSLTPEAMQGAASEVAELREATQCLIDRAQEAGELRPEVVVDDIRTLMCGVGSMMAADALGVMSYDWRRQLEFALDGMRTVAKRAAA